MSPSTTPHLTRRLGTWEVVVTGVALVVAASTLVSDFTGYLNLGGAFAIALLLGFFINLLLGLSAAHLGVAFPRAGALYDYAGAVIGGPAGRFLATFLGLTFFSMFALGISGETVAGAWGMQALTGSDADIRLFVVLLSLLGVLPNLLGIRTAAWVSAGLLLLMLGIRWSFGLAGFLGLGDTGAWTAANLDIGIGAGDWFGSGGILAGGLALAMWSFLGIEFACSLGEDLRAPRRSLPRGIVLGLILILLTSLVLGLGTLGSAPPGLWLNAVDGPLGARGEAPQLAVAHLMFGEPGRLLMALASVAATFGSLTVAFAAMPRLLFSIARDGRFFGPLSPLFARVDARRGTPVTATLFTVVVYLVPALFNSAVIDWVFSAAYVWVLLYGVMHVLSLLHGLREGHRSHFGRRWPIPVALTGLAGTGAGLYYAFAGSHLQYGGRALIALGIALAVTALSDVLSRQAGSAPTDLHHTGGTAAGRRDRTAA